MFTSSYSGHLFEPKKLRAVAKQLAKDIDKLQPDAIAVRGKSGIALAFAISMVSDIPIITVRKPNESSHGTDVEGAALSSTQEEGVLRYLIVDDFVASGDTALAIANKLDSYLLSRQGLPRSCGPAPAGQCIGVLQAVQYSARQTGLPRVGADPIPCYTIGEV